MYITGAGFFIKGCAIVFFGTGEDCVHTKSRYGDVCQTATKETRPQASVSVQSNLVSTTEIREEHNFSTLKPVWQQKREETKMHMPHLFLHGFPLFLTLLLFEYSSCAGKD